LSESPHYCTISFSEPANATDATEFEEKLKMLAPDASLAFEPYAFASQNIGDFPLKPASGASLASIALSAIPIGWVAKVAPDFNSLFAAKSASLQELVSDFNADGCLEVESGALRVMIIAYKSEKNGQCK
jgi:hypothetical protein